MKRTLSMITLAAFATMLLGSCSKINERIDSLEKKVDGIENERIASIQTQIDNIGNSISDLGTIRSNIQTLTDGAKAQGEDITALQAADKALDSRIGELSKYVGDTLKAYATEEWARATFLTLEQYKKTCDTIAEIDARIGALDADLTKKISDCADSLTTWINVKFEGYYTAAQMDAKLALMKSAVDSAKAAGEITDAKADSLAVELAKVQPAIDSAKATLTAEYTAAIDTAITALDGKLTKQIQDEIEKVNETVTALAQRVGTLEFQVRDLLGRVEALESRVQSVTIVPDYSDGSVKVDEDGYLHLDCIITPASATRWLGIGNFTILVKGVAGTKAGVETIRIASPWDLKIDWTKGTASMKVKIADKLPGNDSTLAVAINVKDNRNGSDYTTEFVPVMVIHPVSVRLDKQSIVAPYRTSDSAVILKPTVKNAKDNSVTWTSTEHCTSVDGTGKVTIKANVMGKDTIVVKTKEGNATDTCFVFVGCVEIGGVTWATKNLGAEKETERGHYFCWGGTDGYVHFYEESERFEKASDNTILEGGFIVQNHKFYIGLNEKGKPIYSKYTNAYSVLEPEDDAATAYLGPGWRMPTSAEFQALYEACGSSYDANTYLSEPCGASTAFAKGVYFCGQYEGTENGGCLFCDGTNKVFFPGAGYGQFTQLKNEGYGYYWSSTLTDGPISAYYLLFKPDGMFEQDTNARYLGLSIRPVAD